MTPRQISALRLLKDSGEQPPRNTGDALVRRGMARKSKVGGYFITPMGTEWVTKYVARTGDGPEDLKARFSFLSR